MHVYLTDEVIVKIYNRTFSGSTNNYLVGKHKYEEVEKNHSLIKNDLKSNKLCVLRQVHGNLVVNLKNPWEIGNEPEADAFYTSMHGLTLGIQTADCVPVLLASQNSEIIAAIHCGWRSVIDGILEKVIEQTNHNLSLAAIGPSISALSYEVGEDFYENFINKLPNSKKFFSRKDNENKYDYSCESLDSADSLRSSTIKFLFDISGLVKDILSDNGVKIVKHFAEDTFSNPNKYPSNRYSVLRNAKYQGSILSSITKFKK